MRGRRSKKMSIAYIGLAMFIITVIVNVAGLSLDAFLALNDLPTVTDYVRGNHAIGVPILLLQLFAFVGLFAHFYLYDRSI